MFKANNKMNEEKRAMAAAIINQINRRRGRQLTNLEAMILIQENMAFKSLTIYIVNDNTFITMLVLLDGHEDA